eukprot:SAG11_NODE_4794_length_1764_cov_1.622222_1_plen_143_part_00
MLGFYTDCGPTEARDPPSLMPLIDALAGGGGSHPVPPVPPPPNSGGGGGGGGGGRFGPAREIPAWGLGLMAVGGVGLLGMVVLQACSLKRTRDEMRGPWGSSAYADPILDGRSSRSSGLLRGSTLDRTPPRGSASGISTSTW